MNDLLFIISLLLSSIIAGFIGSLTGLGGATVLVPIYTLFLSIPIEYATGASLISTIATSSGAASAYIKDRITNIKIGMGLEIATTTGAIVGSLIAHFIYEHHLAFILFIIFGIVILTSIYPQIKKASLELPKPIKPDWTTRVFQLYGKYYDLALKQEVEYYGVRWWLGEIIMFFAGMISGLLGIGSGALKVIGMDWAMNLPIKVSTTTSNFMIGVTAATSSSLYWVFGYIQPVMAGITAIGVLIGSFAGSKVLPKIRNVRLRLIFMLILAFLGIEMIIRGVELWI
ncbi:sulfite exporter TauE/SafE family protein [Sulfolobus sp. S-194]|uniref:sulfite exporter TauE/SafE family protein n=1 Tax=Sulfolobus sp. S-194 TaxID=2512240 RepID=UPI001436EC2D|nr:sulfite exporter TauE/SafE family protein [Sulfolobus sp. S-194]QIW25156.1 sulfite exporter TauE/SafE family protein [Sulfolobus sp. S-194]